MHSQIAEVEVFAPVEFAGRLLKVQVDRLQMQDAQDAAEQVM
jgi:hypothetical protein